MQTLVRSIVAGLVQRLREAPFRTLGVLAAISLVEIFRYFPELLPRWAYFGTMVAVVVGLIVIGWPLLTIGRSGRDALAQREQRLREAEANPLVATSPQESRSADA